MPADKISSGKNILIAEDEKPMARALGLKLKDADFVIKIVSDGQEALTVLEKECFDLILLDLIMPVMDGFSVLAKLKEKGVKTPVIVLTNLSQEEDIERIHSYGVADYFIKSETSLAELVQRVQQFFTAIRKT